MNTDRRRGWRRLGVVAGVAIALAGVFAFAGDAHATAYRRTFLQFNLCGNACSRGDLRVSVRLEALIRTRTPFAVTLNELCENQYVRLRADLPGYTGRFDPTGPTCHNGARYGNAILARAATLDLVGSWQLPNPAGDETRRLMCVQARPADAVPLLLCVTHISNWSENIGAQVWTVAGILHRLTVTSAVLLGGDFNTDPADPRMSPLYSSCYLFGTGDFEEADSAGCASRSAIGARAGSDVVNGNTYTTHKFDYIFLSAGDWSASAADVDAAGGLSDHEALWATTILRSERSVRRCLTDTAGRAC